MKNLFGIRLATLMLSCTLTSAFANEYTETSSTPITQIDVAVDVFAVDNNSTIDDYSQILANNRPEHSPRITAKAGKSVLIDLDTSANKGETVQVKFTADNSAVKYDLELVINESDIVANVASDDINKVLVFIADIKGVSKLIKVTTNIQAPEHSIASRAEAEQQLNLQRKKRMVEPDQHFFQWDKVFQTNGDMDQLLAKGKASPRNGFNNYKGREQNRYYFVYITNNDNSRPIRGVLKARNKNMSQGMNFVVLPNKTIFLGEWSGVARFKFTDVSFLTEEEQNAIRKAAEEQQLARQQLTFSKQLLMSEPDQHYFQAEKVWQKDRELKKRVQRSNANETGMSNKSRYHYLTNNDSNRVIKGVIIVNSVGKRSNDTAINFVILPNKSIYFGQWDSKYSFKLSEVSFLTEEETETLGKMKNSE